MTRAEYAQGYVQARRETARLVLAGKDRIHREYERIIAAVSQAVRKHWGDPGMDGWILSAISPQGLYEAVLSTVREGVEWGTRYIVNLERQYLVDVLKKVPGNKVNLEQVGQRFEELVQTQVSRIKNEADFDTVNNMYKKSYVGTGWGGSYGRSGKTGKGIGFYRFNPETKKREWVKEIPIEYTFTQSHRLSERVWDMATHSQEDILNVVWGGRAQGRDAVQIAKDLEVYLKPQGGKLVQGRWGKLKPGTEQYVKRMGAAGIDYRALRIARTELYRNMQESVVVADELNPATTGTFDWVLQPGREVWPCTCQELAAAGPYTKDTLPVYPHPNCDCQIHPRLKDSDKFMQQLLDYVHERDTPGALEIEEWSDKYELQAAAGSPVIKISGIDLDEKIKKALAYGVTTERQARRLGDMILTKAKNEDKDVYDVLIEYRDFGATDSYGTRYTHRWEEDSEVKEIRRLEGVYAWYPTDWIVKSIDAAKEHPLLVQESKDEKGKKDRGYYDHYGDFNDAKHKGHPTLKLDESFSVAAHEFAHRMECIIPEIVTLEKEFYERRTKGYPLIRINTLKGFEDYKSNEKTRIDKFNHPYMGKDYGVDAYELLSTGIEKLFYGEYTNKLDRDFDSFIIGLLSGVGYVRYNRKNRK